MAKPPEVRQPAVSAAPPTLMVEILDAFLDWVDRNKAARTYAWSTGFQTATDGETSFPAGSLNAA